jgi:alkanesulfonate monooxygenase SsuD/methylene tetrahydromethanopterin reductase-like flavin-dependent oxidoreductase (luciferase family)
VSEAEQGSAYQGLAREYPEESGARARLWGRDTVGVVLPTEFPYGFPGREVVFRAARSAEDMGFDAIWVGDHILWHCPNLECLSVLGALTALTQDVVIGSAVLLLPLRNPVHVAKALTTLDQLSGGRVALGVGIGGENPIEFAVSHSDLRTRGRRTDESLRVISGLIRGDGVPAGTAFDGVPSFRLEPGVVSSPGPPLLVGGRSTAALKRAAVLGEGWISLFVSPRHFASSWQEVLDRADAEGRAPGDLLSSMLVFVLVDDDLQNAELSAADWLQGQFGMAPDQILPYAAIGPPSRVIEKLEGYRRAGVQHLILSPMGPDPLEQIELLGFKVLHSLEGS